MEHRGTKLSLKSAFEILWASTQLGFTSFGGPIAHLSYFHHAYVEKRKWMDEESYADLVALCQFLPGPASSQVGIGVGVLRGGLLGGFLAWIGFTLPSAIALTLFAFLLKGFNLAEASWIHGLKVVAVAIVAHAVWTMGKKLANDKVKITIAIAATAILLLWPSAFLQIAIIGGAGVLGLLIFGKNKRAESLVPHVKLHKGFAVFCLILFAVLLFALPVLSTAVDSPALHLFDSFYRSGSLVFGGGHVVLPLIESEVVPIGWVSEQDFLAGYGATQAVPGPMFTFSAYLGAMAFGTWGAVVALIAIFLPSFLLVVGVLPFWNALRQNQKMQGALMSINAAVVGILLAALYHPLWTTAILGARDFVLASVLFIMIQFWKVPPWIIVISGAIGGVLLQWV